MLLQGSVPSVEGAIVVPRGDTGFWEEPVYFPGFDVALFTGGGWREYSAIHRPNSVGLEKAFLTCFFFRPGVRNSARKWTSVRGP